VVGSEGYLLGVKVVFFDVEAFQEFSGFLTLNPENWAAASDPKLARKKKYKDELSFNKKFALV